MCGCLRQRSPRRTAALSDLMGNESVHTTKEHCALFKRDELRRKHSEFSVVASVAREGRL